MAIRLLLIAGEGWEEAAEPWLRGVEAWRDPRPTVVLTPQRAQGFYLRGRLVAEGRALLGVRFWTPSDARTFLRGALKIPQRPATQAEQALMTRSCAEKLLRGRADGASWTSAAQDPAPFLRAYDLLVGAGWTPDCDGAAHGRELATEFARALRSAGLLTQAELHRQLRAAAPRTEPPLARVLLLGFNAAHWPLWDLLQAVCRQTEQAEVALEQPREFGEALDRLWIGSWETFAGGGYEVPESESRSDGPFAELAESYESGAADVLRTEAEIHFVASAGLADHVRALTLQALDYLRRPGCTRLGLVFPEADALALGVAEQLRALDIPLDDGPGVPQPGLFESRPWQTWLEWQEEPTARRLIEWLRACDAAGRGTGLASVPARDAAAWIDRALARGLVDHPDFFSRQMEGEGTEARAVALFLEKSVLLPADGLLGGLLAATREALRRLGWDDFLVLLPESTPPGLEALTVSRRAYLAWLRETGDSRERMRAGDHFYGKVHLLVYGQLAGQRWSHLILTGLNEGVWPRLGEGDAFGPTHEVAELNARVRQLNRFVAIRGAQGEGHETVTPGHGHCLVPLDRHDLALRDLGGALRATEQAVCLAARTEELGRSLLASDFFSHAWQVKTGRVLDDDLLADLAKKTTERVRAHDFLFPPETPEAQEIAATARAYEARRNPEIPFGRYEFSHETPPGTPIQLPCKEWENAWGHPSGVWLSHVVGVVPWPQGDLSWKLSLGTWAHRWLALAVHGATEGAGLEARVRAAAETDRQAVERRAGDAGIDLCPWWHQLWAQTQAAAGALARSLAPELAGRTARAELNLPRPLEIALPGQDRADFALRGRLDLLLLEPPVADFSEQAFDLTGRRAWVIDFKTGTDAGLTTRRLQKGRGVQIALYGLALRALGAETVAMSVLTPGAVLKPQLEETALRELAEPFRALASMHRSGVFGQSDREDGEHGHAPVYPITTRAIPREILQAKRALLLDGKGA